MTASRLRNGNKHVHYLPTETNVSFKKFSIEEFGKTLENKPYKFLKDTENRNSAISSIATDVSCDHLKGKNNDGDHQKPLRVFQVKNQKMDLQFNQVSYLKDSLRLEQVVAIRGPDTTLRSPFREFLPKLQSYSLYWGGGGRERPPRTKLPRRVTKLSSLSLEQQSSCNTVVFNGQTTLSNSPISSATSQVSTMSHEYLEVKNSFFFYTKSNSSKADINTSIAPGVIILESCSKNFHQLPPRNNEVGYCNQTLDSSKNLDSADVCQEAAHTQIEADIATQLTELSSITKFNYLKPQDKRVASTPTSLVACNVPFSGLYFWCTVQQKPLSSVQNHGSSLTRQKTTSQKKAKSTPSRDRPKKPTVVRYQDNQKWEKSYRHPESTEEKIQVEPFDSLSLFHLETESNGKTFTDKAYNSQTSSPNHCANMMAGDDQIQFQQVKEQLMHQRLPTLPVISH
ncbi:Methylcytosine dioxygenase TET1 [Plecturocebus cupreus]